MSTSGTIRIGISGWRFEPWRGVFYPPTLRQDDELAYASRRLSTIEINGSFYSLQRPEYYAQWREATPPGFVFSVKGGRFITHMLKLRNADAALANFFASGVACLGEKLGPFLWQLPPNLGFDAQRLRAFLSRLPRDTQAATALAQRHDAKVDGRTALDFGAWRPLRHALEVRHDTFRTPAFVELLREQDVALVVADTAGKWPLLEDVTAGFVYVRLHGDQQLYVSGYTPRALARWGARLNAWSEGGQADDARLAAPGHAPPAQPRDVYCYFDNDAKVKAPRDALRLARILGVDWRPELRTRDLLRRARTPARAY
jgi:uncharacterized protein YecE (DUF72 family)